MNISSEDDHEYSQEISFWPDLPLSVLLPHLAGTAALPTHLLCALLPSQFKLLSSSASSTQPSLTILAGFALPPFSNH